MKKLYLGIIIFFLLGTHSVHADVGLHRFMLEYAIVEHTLKGDEGKFNELMEIAKINRVAANGLSKFWWRRAVKTCESEVKRSINAQMNKKNKTFSEEEKDEALKIIMQEIRPCIHSYIYDNYDEINLSIVNRLQNVKPIIQE